jgi:hypothetical protein
MEKNGKKSGQSFVRQFGVKPLLQAYSSRQIKHKLAKFVSLKGLSHEIDFKNVDENGQNLALTRVAAGF